MTSSLIHFAGYDDCPVLENGDVRVVLGPHAGGRILAYELDGENALMLDPNQDGWTWDPSDTGHFGPGGGRFDIGPENTLPRHPALWFGPWTAELTGDLSARMSSVVDPGLGVQVVRDMELAPSGSHLRITQIIVNKGSETIHTCHWSRTFGRGHGIAIVPLSTFSKFPDHYVRYGPGPVMNFRPNDPAIRIREGYLELFDTPVSPKLGLDSMKGWFAYLMPHGHMLVKRYETYPERAYGEMAGLTISLWYMRDMVCELEPIGPLEVLQPGDSASFTEEWWLGAFPFPEQRDALDIVAAGDAAKDLMNV